MIIIEYQESKESEDRDEFTHRDFVDTVLYLWEILVTFLNLLRNCILLIVTSNEKYLLKSTNCVKCFRGIQGSKSTSNMATPSAARSFNALMNKDSSVEHIRKPHKTTKNGIDVQTILNNQLKDLNLLDSDINDNDFDFSKNSRMSTHRSMNTDEGKSSSLKEAYLDKKKKKKEEIDSCKVAQYREAILKYSRISYSDFTSLFNKFVRENGRDFSKANLLHWFSRFTKFIYLKKEICGEPEELREQLSLRAIQSKRSSLVDRLYTLRESNQMNQSIEEFGKNLNQRYLNPIKKLLNVIRGGAGDMNITEHKKIGNENSFSANKPKGNNSQNTGIDDKANIHGEQKYSIIHQKPNTIRTETIDIEKEKKSRTETGIKNLPQTTCRTRKKKMPKFHRTKKETSRRQCPDLIDFENMYQNSKYNLKQIDDKSIQQLKDPKNLVDLSIYSTMNGFVKVSQYVDTKYKKLNNLDSYEQHRSYNSFIEYLDKSDPLPEGIDVKPLPPGGLDEVLNTRKQETEIDDNDYAELEKFRALCQKQNDQAQGTAKQTSVTSSDTDSKNSMFKGGPKVLAKEFNDDMDIEQLNLDKGFQDYKLPNTQENATIPSSKQDRFNFTSPGAANPFEPEERKTNTRERPSIYTCNAKQDDIAKPQETRQVVETSNKKSGHEMRRFIPVRRKLNKQLPSTGNGTKEITGENIEDTGLKDISFANTKSNVENKKESEMQFKNIVSQETHVQSKKPNDTKSKNKTAVIKKFSDSQGDGTQIQTVSQNDTDVQYTDSDIPGAQESHDQHLFDQLSPLNFIDTDNNEQEASESVQGPVFLETNATIDYSRHAVEPSHGDRPNKKKLQSRIKEKIKTKGEANKHLKAKEKPAYYFEDEDLDTTVEDGKESELDESVAEQNEEHNTSSPVVYATDQPQILDNREYMMVPEEIIRKTDPRLKDIEDKYSVASSAEKKDKKKRKEKKGKVQKNIPISFVSDFHL